MEEEEDTMSELSELTALSELSIVEDFGIGMTMDVDVDVILPLTQLETTEAVLLDRRLLFSRKATLKLGTLLNSWTAKTLEMRDADSASDMDVDSE